MNNERAGPANNKRNSPEKMCKPYRVQWLTEDASMKHHQHQKRFATIEAATAEYDWQKIKLDVVQLRIQESTTTGWKTVREHNIM